MSGRPCVCGHVHGGRAYGLCLAAGCDCVEVRRACDGCAEGPAVASVEVLGGGAVWLCVECSAEDCASETEALHEARWAAWDFALFAGGVA